MRLLWLGAVWMVVAISASAQNSPIQATQLPPLQQQWKPEGLPSVQQAPISPGAPGQTTPPPSTERSNIWLPATAANLQALDKVNAQGTTLTIKVGQSGTFGSLTIKVRACMVRPPGQAADAAAFIDMADNHPDAPGFDGWMLQAEPALSMMQHPIYDIRVTGCT
jgi:hypothetical protein